MSPPRIQTLILPLHTVSENNGREHYRVKAKRVKHHRETAKAMCASALSMPALPCVIRITRISPRGLDSGDNLPGASKALRDGIADWLSIDDRDNTRVAYVYDQRRGPPKHHSVMVEIIERAIVVTEIQHVA